MRSSISLVAIWMLSCADAGAPIAGPQGPEGPPGPAGPPGPPGTPDPSLVIANGMTPQNASFNITGQATIGSTVTLNGAVNAPYTWGLNARSQGIMVMPEGPVYDHGGGTLEFTATIIVMNPASGSWLRVAPGVYALGPWGYLYVDLPPKTQPRSTATPLIGAWSDADRAYDHVDRLVLAQRMGAGAIYLNFSVPAPVVNPPI